MPTRKSSSKSRRHATRPAIIVDQANQRHSQILDQAKDDAVVNVRSRLPAGEAEITQSANQAREELRATVASLAVLGARQILEKEVDEEHAPRIAR